MKIRVPATSANIGPGFDSVGVALSKYLTIEILEASPHWLVEHDLGEQIPSNEDNLLIKTALKVDQDLTPHRIKMTSDIPLARGLGSSSSVIVAGIELANQLKQLQLTEKEKLDIATKIEGHPDNVAPAIYGNLVIATYINDQVEAVVTSFPETGFVAFIPNYELKTSDSRRVLPTEMTYKEAVMASSIANVAIASLLSGDLKTAGRMIESDRFHERFRQPLVLEFSRIKELGHENGAYATYLSGAGPTIMTLMDPSKIPAFKTALKAENLQGEIHHLTLDTKGIHVEA